jgi:hypothetical protein
VAFLASDRLVVEPCHGHRDILLAESIDRVNQFHVIEPIGGNDQYLLVSKRYSIVE